jgi:acid stress chaperone HdeB
MQLILRNGRIAVALAILVAAGVSTAQAQTVVDVATITCEQYVTFKVADPKDIGIWLSGYFHGRQGDTRLYLQQLGENFSKLKSECFQQGNSKRSVLEVAAGMYAPSK